MARHSKKNLRRSHKNVRRTRRFRRHVRSALPGHMGNVNPMASYITTVNFDIVPGGNQSLLLDPALGVPEKLTIFAMPPRDTDGVASNYLTRLDLAPWAGALYGSKLVPTKLGYYQEILPFNARIRKIATLSFRTWFKNGLQLLSLTDASDENEKKVWYRVAEVNIAADFGSIDSQVPISLYCVYEFQTPLTMNTPVAVVGLKGEISRGQVTDVNIGPAPIQGRSTIVNSVRSVMNELVLHENE